MGNFLSFGALFFAKLVSFDANRDDSAMEKKRGCFDTIFAGNIVGLVPPQ